MNQLESVFASLGEPSVDGLVCKGEKCHFAAMSVGMKAIPVGQVGCKFMHGPVSPGITSCEHGE